MRKPAIHHNDGESGQRHMIAFEILAAVFESVHGFLPPGKDSPPGSRPINYDEVWEEWLESKQSAWDVAHAVAARKIRMRVSDG